MSNGQSTQKTLEVKIRPYTNPKNHERPDQKGASRVHLSRDALYDLRLDSGQRCYLWKIGEDENTRKEAIAWLTPESSLNKRVIQISKVFQDASGFKLGDDLYICPAGNMEVAETVSLREILGERKIKDGKEEPTFPPELETEELSHWSWYLGDHLYHADEIFTQMIFKNLSYGSHKRSFRVELVNGNPSGVAKFDLNMSVVKILNRDGATNIPDQVAPRLELANIAGIDQALKKLNGFLGNFSRKFKPIYGQRSCGVLLHGGHGTGKTYIAESIVATGWGKAYYIDVNAKAANIKETFRNARRSQPSIIVIDELESIVSKDDVTSQMNVNVLGQEMDNLILDHAGDLMPQVLVIAATLNPSNIPSSLKKKRRFQTQIPLSIPDARARKSILRSLNPNVHPQQREDILDRLGDRTHAYTAEDLDSLLSTASVKLEERLRYPDLNSPEIFIEQEDIEQALLEVRPTAMHDVTLQPPSVRWSEIGGQDNVKKALRLAVETPLKQPELMARLGSTAKKGILLYGPPGCSKTLSAQAMATEVGFNFFAVKGAELLNMYVGESEKAVRDIFARARAASPSIIFFDEIESIGSKRESGGRNSGVNVLTTLLNEMDGIETLKGVMVLAATNQPQALDLALLRPGRFDKLLYVAPPDLLGREEILRVRTRKMDIAEDVDIPELARLTDGYSGAETVSICQTACDYVLEKCMASHDPVDQNMKIHMEDFRNALKTVKKQITPELVQGYEKWAAGARGDTD